MDVIERLDDLAAIVEEAKAMPLSASCLVNRAEVLGLIDEIREMLPTALSHAELVLRDRQSVLEGGRAEANAIIDSAHEEQRRLVSQHEVYLEAIREADAVRAALVNELEAMRFETDDYIDGRLAAFEVTLHNTLTTVERGRERLREDAESAAQPYEDEQGAFLS